MNDTVFRSDRVEYYKQRGELLEVTTCNCCLVDGCHDAWLYKRGDKPSSCGVSQVYLKDWVLITRAEAVKIAKKMGHSLFLDVLQPQSEKASS